MNANAYWFVLAWTCFSLALPQLGSAQTRSAPLLELRQGDRIAIVGNTLAERMQYFSHFETRLQHRFPQHQLVVRNLGWSADQLQFGWATGKQADLFRSKDFADHGHRLEDHRPSVLLAMFGFNESFAGPEGLESFRRDLRGFLKFATTTPFDGQHPPRVVLVTPIPYESIDGQPLADAETNNRRLQPYVAAMLEEAAAAQVGCVDAFSAMQSALRGPDVMTINGVHLNDAGYRALGRVLEQALFGQATSDDVDLTRLHDAVQEKNQQFYYDYRAVNGYYIYGGRKAPFGVVNFPEEFAKLRRMTALRDERIWRIAQGENVPAVIDDSATGSLTPVDTNVPRETVYLSPEEQLATFHLPRGYVAELVASEREFPELANPCHFAIDGRGRFWICTMPTYPMYEPGVPVHDQILILEDTDGDGRADQKTVFADGLHLPTGIELGDGGAYVAQQPNLAFLKDTDGDGKADEQKLLLHGFDSADSHHSISAFTWGPGGEMYFQEGTFHHSQVETPYGPVRVKDAAVFRWEPKTFALDVYVSYPFANPWGHCFDRWGQDFVADASTGLNYFAAAFSGQVIFPQKHRRLEPFLVKQWRPTAGCTLVSSRNFPEETQGDFLITNCIGFQGVLQYRIREEGSGFHAEPVEPLLSSTDPAFRPVDVKIGLDGAVYVCDWYNPLVGHMQHNLRDPKRDRAHGRIWRIRYADRPLGTPPTIENATVDQLMQTLDAVEDQHRYVARRALREHPTDQVLRALSDWLKQSDQQGESLAHQQLEALWVQQHHHAIQPELLETVLTSPEPRARAAAVRVLCYARDVFPDTVDRLVRAAGDTHPRVRLEAVRAASFLSGADGERVLQAAVAHPIDYYLQYTINETTDTLELRGGRQGGAAAAAVERLAAGGVEDAQVVPLVQLSLKQATAGDITRLFSAVIEQPKFAEPTKLRVIQLLRDQAAAKKLQPTISPKKILDLVHSALAKQQSALAAGILGLAEAWTIPGMAVDLQRIATAPEMPAEVAQAALAALAADSSPGAWDLMREMTAKSDDPLVQMRVVRAQAPRNAQQAVKMMLGAMSRYDVPYELVQPAVEAILRNQDGATQLATELPKAKLERDPARLLMRAVLSAGNSNAELSTAVAEAAGLNAKAEPMTAEAKAELARRIDRDGDAVAGEWVFRRAELNCVKCHALSGAGGNIGPDLSSVGANSPIDYLIDSILHPSQQIKEAYVTRRVLTTDGQLIVGVRVDSDAERMVLRNADGRDVTIATENIEEEFEGPSLMPEGLQNLMTQREFIDLMKFLSVLGKPGPYAINTRPTIQHYRALSNEDVRQQLLKADEGKMETMLDGIPPDAWSTQIARVDGRLPLEPMEPNVRLPLVLAGEINVTMAGPVAVRVDPPAGAQVVVHGKSIAANGLQPVDLKMGKHSIFIVFESPPQAAELTVEVLRPENAATQLNLIHAP